MEKDINEIVEMMEESKLVAVKKVRVSARKLLCVDVLNYCHLFFGTPNRWNSPHVPAEKVKKFVQAAKATGWTLRAFIDNGIITPETQHKWRTRREQEIRTRVRKMPQGCNIMIGDMFKREGVPVLYSQDADCDDTIIAYAYSEGGSILSQDNDFFRYDEQVPVYSRFSINRGKLVLVPHPNKTNRYISQRNIIIPPPATTSDFPNWNELPNNLYLRGSPSPLTRDFGNIHKIVRPLRQAAYFRVGVKTPILEEFPEWDDQSNNVFWSAEEVAPDNSLDELLNDPKRAIAHFFPNLEKPENISDDHWFNHCYAIKVIIYEIICRGSHQCLLDVLEKNISSSRKGTNTQSKVFETRKCVICHKPFSISVSEKNRMDSKGWVLPKKCPICRSRDTRK